MIRFLKALKDWTSPSYWAHRIGEKSGLYGWAMKKRRREKAMVRSGQFNTRHYTTILFHVRATSWG